MRKFVGDVVLPGVVLLAIIFGVRYGFLVAFGDDLANTFGIPAGALLAAIAYICYRSKREEE